MENFFYNLQKVIIVHGLNPKIQSSDIRFYQSYASFVKKFDILYS